MPAITCPSCGGETHTLTVLAGRLPLVATHRLSNGKVCPQSHQEYHGTPTPTQPQDGVTPPTALDLCSESLQLAGDTLAIPARTGHGKALRSLTVDALMVARKLLLELHMMGDQL